MSSGVRCRCSRLRSSGGFTLVELLVVMAIVGLVAAGVLGLYSGLTRSVADQGTRMQSQDSARTATNQMTRYLRAACSSESNLTSRSDAFVVAQPQDVVFYTDLDGDDNAEKVRYYLDGNTLRMQTAEPNMTAAPPTYPGYATNGVVIQGVRNGTSAVFSYYRYDEHSLSLVQIANPNTPELLEQVVAVDVRLVINEEPKLARGAVELTTRVQVRQRYDGGLSGS